MAVMLHAALPVRDIYVPQKQKRVWSRLTSYRPGRLVAPGAGTAVATETHMDLRHRDGLELKKAKLGGKEARTPLILNIKGSWEAFG